MTNNSRLIALWYQAIFDYRLAWEVVDKPVSIRCCFGMAYPTEPKGFVPNPIPNIFLKNTGKKWEINRKGKSGKAQ
jgi:hypothetical protein